MPKYLVQASYTAEGVKGLLKDGGTKRRAAVEEMAKSLGAKVEAFYFAFGETDVFIVIDAPDHASVAAATLTAAAGGGVHTRTTVLMSPEEVDQAAKKAVTYRPPGR